MYAVVNDVVQVGFITAVVLAMAAIGWFALTDKDYTVGGWEID